MQNKVFGNDKRTVLLRKNVICSLLLKGWSGLVMFLLVPLTLSCIGEYKNGVWLTISSMLVLMDNLDIGLGNGLRNKLAAYQAEGNQEKSCEVVSTTFYMLIGIILPVALLLIILTNVFDLYSFFNVDAQKVGNLYSVVTVMVLLISSTFVFKFVGNIYMGLQLPAVNNAIVSGGHTLMLLGTMAMAYMHVNSLVWIAVINTASPLLAYLAAYPYTFWYKYPQLNPKLRYFKMNSIGSLLTIGVKFFILQISSMLIFTMSNILISRMYSPSMVTPYQITYRYFSVILLVFTVICAPYWTATTDAYTRGDMEWIKKSIKHINHVVCVIIGVMILMILCSARVYKLWLTDLVTTIPVELTILMALYTCITIISMAYCYFLNGIGALNLQLVCTVGGALLFVPLVHVLSLISANITNILIAMCAVNIPSLLCNIVLTKKIVNNNLRNSFWFR